MKKNVFKYSQLPVSCSAIWDETLPRIIGRKSRNYMNSREIFYGDSFVVESISKKKVFVYVLFRKRPTINMAEKKFETDVEAAKKR